MRKCLLGILLSLFLINNLFSQSFQILNGGFENWDGSSADDEPSYWNAFPSAQCDLTGFAALGCSSATATRHAKSSDVRPGSTGAYSCKIFATEISILGSTIVANGNLTTGQIRIGSTTPTNPENYNITRAGNSAFSQALNAKPDSLVFWAKFECPSASQKARVSAVIHDNYSYRDPNGSDANAPAHRVAVAERNFKRGNQTWQRYSIPFNYSFPADNPHYILLSFTTNKNAGEGSADDALYIDDVELVYNTFLENLLVDGTAVPEFLPNVYTYSVEVECGITPQISAVTQSNLAQSNIHVSDDNNEITVTVSNGNQETVYTVYVNHVYREYVTDEICQNEMYNNYGFNLGLQGDAGVFYHEITLSSSENCDTVRDLTLTVNPVYDADTVSLMICNGASYDFFGQDLTQAGVYDTVLNSEFGCDSLVVLNLTVGDYYQSVLNESICSGEAYMDNGFNMSESGSDSLMYVAENGCDSLVVLNLTVNLVYENIIYDTIIAGAMYHLNGFDINDLLLPGDYVYEQPLLSVHNCDSVIFLHLNVTEIPQEPQEGDVANLSVFPNPTFDEFAVEIEGQILEPIHYLIFDLSAQMVQRGSISEDKKEVDVSRLKPGIYLIYFKQAGVKPEIRRLVKY